MIAVMECTLDEIAGILTAHYWRTCSCDCCIPTVECASKCPGCQGRPPDTHLHPAVITWLVPDGTLWTVADGINRHLRSRASLMSAMEMGDQQSALETSSFRDRYRV